MTLFEPRPALVKCNEHVPNHITGPVINNTFSTTLALTLHRGSTVSSLRRSSGGSNTQRLLIPWVMGVYELEPHWGQRLHICHARSLRRSRSLKSHLSVVCRDKRCVTTQLRTAGWETTSVTWIYVTYLNKPVVNLWFVLFVGRSSLFLCQYLTWAYWLYPKEFLVFLS